jgi:inosose dehydratase
LRSVVRYADPKVGLCVDTAWARAGGCDPIAWISDYPQRIHYFHLRNQKDRWPTEDLLEGEIDFRELIAAASKIGYDGWLSLELWHPHEIAPVRSIIEDVQRSKAYLQKLLEEV